MRDVVLSIDLGATWTRIGLVSTRRDRTIPVVERFEKFRTLRSSNGHDVASYIVNKINNFLNNINKKINVISVAMIGPIKFPEGIILKPPNHPAKQIPIGPVFRNSFPEKFIVIANDTVAGAWGEYNIAKTFNPDLQDFAYVAVGTGVGAGIIIQGSLLLGRRGDSHEVGHIVVKYDSMVRCGCGGVGHWEALGSGRAFNEGNIDAKNLNRVTAAGIAGIVACYDPEEISLGGGLVESNIIKINIIKNLLDKYVLNKRIPIIYKARSGGNANLIGAYYLAIKPDKGVWRLNGW